MPKIVVTNDQSFSQEQKSRLESLGEVTYFDSTPESAEEYLKRVQGADIICSGSAGLKEAFPRLKDVYITVSFVSVAFLDVDVLRSNNVTLSNAPGANRHAVCEWIMGMVISLMRNLPSYINRDETLRQNGSLPPLTPGLAGRSVTILGAGHVGSRVGELATAFGMKVSYFKRGNDLIDAVKQADTIIDTLGSNPSTAGLLDEGFFSNLKQGAYFVSVTRSEIMDENALLKALDEGRLAGAALDCGGILVGDTNDPYYSRLKDHPKILATPHIAYNSEMSMKVGNDIVIDNVEAWIKGKPINLL